MPKNEQIDQGSEQKADNDEQKAEIAKTESALTEANDLLQKVNGMVDDLDEAEQKRVENAKIRAEEMTRRAINIVRGLEKIARNLKDMPNDRKKGLLPPMGMPFKLNNIFYFVVSYMNVGKMRVSCDYLGMTPNPDPPGTPFDKSKESIIMKDGTEMNRLEFERWRRERYPTEQEIGRNPDNTTLGVHNAVMGGGAQFKGEKGKG